MIYDILSELLGLDLSVYNQDMVFVVCAVLFILIVSFFYDLMLIVLGYLGGKRR